MRRCLYPARVHAGMREAMFLSPLYYFIEIGYGILLKGCGLVGCGIRCWA